MKPGAQPARPPPAKPLVLTLAAAPGIICPMVTNEQAFFTFQDLTYTVGNPPRRITVGASLPAGGVLAVKGASGAGKTTLLRILGRLQPPLAGEVHLAGRSWRAQPPTLWRRRVLLLGQEPARFRGNLRDNLERPFRLGVVKRELAFDPVRAKDLLAAVGLSPALLAQDASYLSGGEAARMALVRALLLEPAVLLLDEPTASLDPETRAAVCRLLALWLAGDPNIGPSPGPSGGQGHPRATVLVSHTGDEDRFCGVAHLDLPAGDPA